MVEGIRCALCIVHQGIKDAWKPNADTRKPHPPPVTFAFPPFFPSFANFRRKSFVTLQFLSGYKICTMSLWLWERARWSYQSRPRENIKYNLTGNLQFLALSGVMLLLWLMFLSIQSLAAWLLRHLFETKFSLDQIQDHEQQEKSWERDARLCFVAEGKVGLMS